MLSRRVRSIRALTADGGGATPARKEEAVAVLL